MVEGKNEEMSTLELSGGARIHYIFQLIFMKSLEMDYINTSHPNFIGGSKAVEVAIQQIKSSIVPMPISRVKDGTEPDKAPTSERSIKSRAIAILARQANGIVPDQAICPAPDSEKMPSSGSMLVLRHS